ncbi:MAG: FtsX-like permease family protein [Pricia sp.]
MIFTSIKIAFRGFLRNRLFTAFNLVSLTVGLLVAVVAIGYVAFENSYDKFHENSENIYCLGWTYRSQDYSVVGFENNADEEQLNLVRGLKEIPGIEEVAQFITSENLEFIQYKGNRVEEKGFLTTNTPQNFTSLFTWNTLAGSLYDFGTDFNKVLLTRSSGLKLFGSAMEKPANIIGETILVGQESYKVAAVIEDVPANSHFDFSLALSKPIIDYWGSRIYLSTADNIDYHEVQERINAGIASMNPSVVKDPLYKQHFLQPLEDIHLKSNILYELKIPGNYSFIYLIGGFAVFILIITLFNYTNFTLAMKSDQAKSIGIKKALGAKNVGIARQFVFEGVLLALLALPILGLILGLVVPVFNEHMGVDLTTGLRENSLILVAITGLAVILGILASITPAVFLASKNVLSLFNQKLRDNRFENFSIRKYLIISQFIILIVISSVSYVVLNQMNFIENKDLGFKKEGILYAYTSTEKQDVFQQKLKQIPEIDYVGNGSALGIETFNQTTYRLEDSDEIFDDANQLYLDYNALKAYNIKTVGMLDTISNRQTIINRTAAEKLANLKNIAPEELIGTTIITEPEYISEEGQAGFPFTIDGIFEDINLFSLREKVSPYFITVSPNIRMGGSSIIAFDPTKRTVIMNKIKAVYESIDETFPLETEYLSQNLQSFYKQDKQTVDLILWMNVLAIILAAVGIIGITMFLVLSKKKEIGIRRVLGASRLHIMGITIKEYIYFIGIALAISWPIAWYGSQRWLSNFAYRVNIDQFVFPSVGILIFIGTALLVGTVSLNAARKNPAKSLRAE